MPTTVEIIDAKPAQALIQAADKHDARVIVVGSWGESPLQAAPCSGRHRTSCCTCRPRPVLCVPAAD